MDEPRYDDFFDAKFSDLLGKIISSIDRSADQIDFILGDGSRYSMFHSQDCCESVKVDDIAGDLHDLIGSPITKAEEATSRENPPGVTKGYQDSFTWTFYHLATVNGYVTIRWYGESNGYYSEKVDFVRLKEAA